MKDFALLRRIRVAVIATLSAMAILFNSSQAQAVDIGPMTWTPRADWINVKSPWTTVPSLTQGAMGDNMTDDTAAIQAIFNYVCSHYNGPNVTIYFPVGTYKITTTITMSQPMSGLSVLGCGSGTVISWAGPVGGAMYAPDGEDGSRYIGLVWEGNNTAAVAYECDPQTVYQGGIRHENESFRDINAPATYSYRSDNNGNYTTSPQPPTAAIVSGYTNNPPSYVGETQVWNCRFYNCTTGVAESFNVGNFFCWFYDSCEFDECGTGINMWYSGGNVITNCHFQNNTVASVANILGGGNNHIRHCTSTGSAYFFSDPGSLGNPYDFNVIEDCWVDSWTNPNYAMFFQRAGPNTVFDCTFTSPPAGANSPINSSTVDPIKNQLILSNNYAPGLSTGTPIVNCNGQPNLIDKVPQGLRFGALTLQSANQTFLNTNYPAESAHILDITQAPYRALWTYPNSNGFPNPDPTVYTMWGVPDVSAALQAAVNDAKTANNGTIVYIPSGIFNVTSTINVSGSNFSIQGNGYTSELCWFGAGNSSIISITSPQNLSVQNIRLAVQDSTVAGVTATSSAATALTFDGITYNTFQSGNPGAGGATIDGPGLVLTNLPAGSTVYIPLLDAPLTVQNCGAAQILTKYLAVDGQTSVSGVTPPSGFFGTIFTEGGQSLTGNYDINVYDNQDLIFGDYYVEQEVNNISMSRGSGTETHGRVTIGGFNTASGNTLATPGSQYLVNVNNYAGRLFYGSAGIGNFWNQYPVSVYQTGSNPIDMIFAGTSPYLGYTFNLGSSANLIATLNVDQSIYANGDITDTPNPLTEADLLSMAQGLDHFRQLEAVDLSVQDGISTDGPPVAQYAFEGNALDMTGAYNGTTQNITYLAGLGAQAAEFDGASSNVQIANPVSGDFSIAMWLYTADTGGTGQWYSGHGLVDGFVSPNASDFGTAVSGGKFAFGVGNSDTTLTSTSLINDRQWHHVVATRSASSGAMQVYVDGVLNNSMTGPTGALAAAANLRIGSLATAASGGFFNGVIDQVQIFNYVLSVTDVAALCNRTKDSLPLPDYNTPVLGSVNPAPFTGLGYNPAGWSVSNAYASGTGARNLTVVDGGSPFSGDGQSMLWVDTSASSGGSGLQAFEDFGPTDANSPVVETFDFRMNPDGSNTDLWIFAVANWWAPTAGIHLFGGTTSGGIGANVGGSDHFLGTFQLGIWYRVQIVMGAPSAGPSSAAMYMTPWYGNGAGPTTTYTIDGIPQPLSVGFTSFALYTGTGPGAAQSVNLDNMSIIAGAPLVVPPATGTEGNLISNGIVGYWKLNELSGGISNDSSGQYNAGSWVNSPSPTTDTPPDNPASGAASLSFNGVNQFVSMGNPTGLPSGKHPRTICGWGRASNTNGGWRWIAAYGSPSGSEAMFIGMNGTTLDGGAYGDDLEVPNFWDNNWHFIVLTYDGTTAKLYADGNLVASDTRNWNLVPSACYIGEQVNNGNEFWNGEINDVRIYDRALSAQEISQFIANNAPVQGSINPSPFANLGYNPGGWSVVNALSANGGARNLTVTQGGSPFSGDDQSMLWVDSTASTSGAGLQAFYDFNPTPGNSSVVETFDFRMNPDGTRTDLWIFSDYNYWNGASGVHLTSQGTYGAVSAGVNGSDTYLGTLLMGVWYRAQVVMGPPSAGTSDAILYLTPWYGNNPGPTTSYLIDGISVGANTGFTSVSFYTGTGPGEPQSINIDNVSIVPNIPGLIPLNSGTDGGLITDGEGLVANWKLDESTGGLSFDSSGQYNIGEWENGPVFSSSTPSAITFPNAGSLTFNGVNQYVNMGNLTGLPSGKNARTLCGWAKAGNTNGGWRWIAAYGTPGTSQAMFIGMNGTTLDGGAYADDLQVANFWDNNWHFIALTYDGTTAKLYADGNLVASDTRNWNLVPGPCYIGEQVNGWNEYWNGNIDDVRIYARALSAAEIAQLAAGNPNP